MQERFDPYRKWLGIPPRDQPPHHYRLLGIEPFESDADIIANAADGRMAQVKSFQGGKHSAASQRILNELAAAKVCLLNAEKKADYDRRLRQQLAAGGAAAGPVATPVAAETPCFDLSTITSIGPKRTGGRAQNRGRRTMGPWPSPSGPPGCS